MDGIRILLFPAFVQGTAAQITEPSIDFYFTHEAVLEQGGAAATAQWTTRCLAGGEFADVARGYAPDPRMSADERKAQAAKFDRREFVRIATALADYMVLEGRADYFAGTLFTHPAPWTAALDATAYARHGGRCRRS